jgi:hypothetical protein
MGTITQPVPGWYRDPSRRHEHRWWNGSAWTPYVMTLGMRSVDYGDEPVAIEPADVALATEVPAAEAETAVAGPEVAWPIVVWGLVLLGAALLVVGAILPWAEASSGTASFSGAGIDGNGGATLAAGVAIGLICLVVLRRKLAALLIIGVAVLAGAVGVHDALDISDKADRLVQRAPTVTAGVGIGVWLTLAGAAIALVGGVAAYAVAARRR